jgi:hypothetical protein
LLNLPVFIWLIIISAIGGLWFNLYIYGLSHPTLITYLQRYDDPNFDGKSKWFWIGASITMFSICVFFAFLSLFDDCWRDWKNERRRRQSDAFNNFLLNKV